MDRWLIRNIPKEKNIIEISESTEESMDMSQMVVENYIETAEPEKEKQIEDNNLTPDSRTYKSETGQKRRRLNKFCNSWIKDQEFSGWLTKSASVKNEQEYAFCNVCHCDITAHRSDIRRHSSSEKHVFNFRQVKSNKKIFDIVATTPEDNLIRRAELKLCGLLATNNLPFALMDILTPLCADIFPDSNIATKMCNKRTKATHLVKDSLGATFRSALFDILREPGCFFSLVMDETTDVSAKKQCAIAVMYYSKTNNVKVTFFDMVETASGKAEDLFNCLKTSILSRNIPMSNLIGFSSDTTNVMVGEHNSVFSHLKSELPNILCVKCSCHMIHLAASKACLKLPRSVEDLLRNTGSHFNRSFGRQQKFKEFQNFFKTEIHKILLPANTRWLSLVSCVNRVLEQYEPLAAYFRELLFEDPSKTTDEIVNSFHNKFTKIYLEFMSYVLGVLTDFNVLFQSESPLIHRLKPDTEKLLMDLCCNFMNFSDLKGENIFTIDHKNPRLFVPLSNIYLGISTTESLQNLKHIASQSEIDQFMKSCLNFYIELVSDIKTRFDFSDPIFNIIRIVEPKTAQSYEFKSLQKIVERFPILKKITNLQMLDNEWKQHALLNHAEHGLDCGLSCEEYWRKVFELKNAVGVPLFPNLQKMFSLILILPFSNACVERIFSDLKNIKTDHRNSLDTTTLTSLISTKKGIKDMGGCLKFEPSREMINAKIWAKKRDV